MSGCSAAGAVAAGGVCSARFGDSAFVQRVTHTPASVLSGPAVTHTEHTNNPVSPELQGKMTAACAFALMPASAVACLLALTWLLHSCLDEEVPRGV